MVSFPSGRVWVGLKIHHHIGDRHQLGSVLPFGDRTVLAFWFTYYMTKPLGRFCWLSVQIQIQLFVGFVIPYYVTEVLCQNLSLERKMNKMKPMCMLPTLEIACLSICCLLSAVVSPESLGKRLL